MPLNLSTLVSHFEFSGDRIKLENKKIIYTKESGSSETTRSLLVTKVLEKVAQDLQGLDPDALTLGGQEFADHPATHETHTHSHGEFSCAVHSNV